MINTARLFDVTRLVSAADYHSPAHTPTFFRAWCIHHPRRFVANVIMQNKSLTPKKLVWIVAMLTGFTAAFFTNDTMCIALTKTVCRVAEEKKLHPGPFMVAIAMSANIGSAMTQIGNPQNAIIASLSGVSFAKFLGFSCVAAVICLIVNTVALTLWYRKELQAQEPQGEEPDVLAHSITDETTVEYGSDAAITEANGLHIPSLEDGTAHTESYKEAMKDEASDPPPEPMNGSAGAPNDTLPSEPSEILAALTTEPIDESEGNRILFCLGPYKKTTERHVFRALLMVTVTATLAGFLANLDIGWCAVTGGLFAMALDATINHRTPDRIFERINWQLLVFFSGLFITIEGLQQTGIPAQLLAKVENVMNMNTFEGVCDFTAIVAVGCNVFNNVPFVLLIGLAHSTDENGNEKPFMESIGEPDLAWILLAWVSTVSGNLTLMGSVANLIVAEEGKKFFEMTFTYYTKFSFPITIVTMFLGVAVIEAMWRSVYG